MLTRTHRPGPVCPTIC